MTTPESDVGSMLTLEHANRIIHAALVKAREMALAPIGVAVLDAGGHLKALQAEDGLTFLRVRICQAKAWGALGFGVDSAQIAQRYAEGGVQAGFVEAVNALSGGRVVPLPGGILIRNGAGEVVGAVGVAGAASDDDAACARAGIAAAGFV